MRLSLVILIGLVVFMTGGTVSAQETEAVSGVFTRTLQLGSEGEDVRLLQNYLISQEILAVDLATGHFGVRTETAVKEWQAQLNIVSSGTPATTGYGVVGPRSRAVLEAHGLVAGAQIHVASDATLQSAAKLKSDKLVTVFSQDSYDSIKGIAFANKNPPKGKLGLVLWAKDYGWTISIAPKHMTPYTGLEAPKPAASHQLSVNGKIPGTSGVIVVGDTIGINLNSVDLEKEVARRDLAAIVMGYTPSKKIVPFVLPQNYIDVSFDLKVPYLATTGSGVGHITTYLVFTDVKNKRALWYGVEVFDPRGARGETVMWDGGDGGLETAFTHASLGKLSTYGTTAADSVALQTATFSSFKKVHFTISSQKLMAAAAAIPKQFPTFGTLSSDPADYRLTSVILNPEVSAPSGSTAHIGLAFRNFEVSVRTLSTGTY